MLKTFIGITSSNTYIWCKKSSCFLIDPSDHLEEIQNFLSEYSLEAIILTHAHADHMHLINHFKCPIYLHEKDFELLKYPNHIGYPHGFPYNIKHLDIIKIPKELLLDDKVIEVIHTPGHSPGSISLYSEGILISGDTLFKQSVGRTDLILGSETQLIQSLKTLMTFPNQTKVYPGHGNKTTIRDEKSHNLYIKKWLK